MIKNMPIEERPRERLIKNGARALSNAELLAIILRTGTKKENIKSICTKLVHKYNLKKLSRINITSLKKEKGIGDAKACQIVACFELGRRTSSYAEKNESVKSAKDIAKLIIPDLLFIKNEQLIGIYLDSRNKVIKKETISIGSVDANIIHPREIFKIGIIESASALILVHNHPSNDPEPSYEDIEVTKQIIKAGEIIGIELLDHIIIGGKRYTSMKENGYL